jgi:integrase
MKCNLPFVKAYRDRHGKPRYYLRKRGLQRVPLPGLPGSSEFLAVYNTALSAPILMPSASRAMEGSFAALCREYVASADFSNLRPVTKSELKRVVERLAAKHGDKPVSRLERQHILRWRDDMQDRPGAANTMVRTMGVLMAFAVDRGYRKDNPAQKIKMMRSTPFRSWTDEELLAFEAKWPLGSLERTGYALALYSSQRRADLVEMGWQAIAGDVIRLKQSKTGVDLEVPIHPELAMALAAVNPRRASAIITGSVGKKLSPVYFGHLISKAIMEAGLPNTCVLHGLRKTTARKLIEAGCTKRQARAITGQKTDAMIDHYSRDADQKLLSRQAMETWTGGLGKKRTKAEGV